MRGTSDEKIALILLVTGENDWEIRLAVIENTFLICRDAATAGGTILPNAKDSVWDANEDAEAALDLI